MFDFRQILAQGRKRVGFLLGAGTSASIKVNDKNEYSEKGEMLIPTVKLLTEKVVKNLSDNDKEVYKIIEKNVSGEGNIEKVLSRIRSYADILDENEVYNYNAAKFTELAKEICNQIGHIVNQSLPLNPNPYSFLASYLGGAKRTFPIEIFTPNYDLLIEESLEKQRIPYFDGFCGGNHPFFDAASIINDFLPERWVRLWKLHGSLGWDVIGEDVVRLTDRKKTSLIYPTHLKYEQTQKMPYSALFERLRNFLLTPDTLLIICGYSYSDSHINAVISESLSANKGASVISFQFNRLEDEIAAHKLASQCSNLSVYCRDEAVINTIAAPWKLGDPLHKYWQPIRDSFWKQNDAGGEFTLGDFGHLSQYCATTRSDLTNVTELEALTEEVNE